MKARHLGIGSHWTSMPWQFCTLAHSFTWTAHSGATTNGCRRNIGRHDCQRSERSSTRLQSIAQPLVSQISRNKIRTGGHMNKTPTKNDQRIAVLWSQYCQNASMFGSLIITTKVEQMKYSLHHSGLLAGIRVLLVIRRMLVVGMWV